MKVVLVTMDSHLALAVQQARVLLAREAPGIDLRVHAAAEWGDGGEPLAQCLGDILSADLVIVSMLFMEEHFQPVLPALLARRDACDAMVCIMSAPEVTRLTRMGRLTMDGKASGPLAWLQKLRPKARGDQRGAASSGAHQMKMLRRIPQILRFIPGTAQDLRIYFLALQYWLAASSENTANLVKMVVNRYAGGARKALRGQLRVDAPIEYPLVGVYHPSMRGRLSERSEDLPTAAGARGRVGLLLMRSYLLAGNTAHYDGVIAALEARGLAVVPAFAGGLDGRPAVERYFMQDGRSSVDAVISLTGFSLVGGPAYNDSAAACALLSRLDVPYLACTPVEFQTLAQWEDSERGLLPVEATMMVAIPELDGATGAMVFGGRAGGAGPGASLMAVHPERADMLAARVARLIELRRSQRAERRIAVVLFCFPPNGGNVGTAAFLSVFRSLHNLLGRLAAEGYRVDVPQDADALRRAVLEGNAARYGTVANVHARIPVDQHVRRERWLGEIETQWGPAPGRQQADGQSIQILGAAFGNVFVGLQPAFGYEGDPMRLLFERGFAPTHAFSAFYRWLREDYAAHAVLHFGTHGALEFMPGKQSGLGGDCWPDRLIGDLPNLYLYASNNPSEGALAKRRSAATLVSHLTPPITEAGLHREVGELDALLQRWRALDPEAIAEREDLEALILAQAEGLGLRPAGNDAATASEGCMDTLYGRLIEIRETLIPCGMHVLGEPPSPEERVSLLLACAETSFGVRPPRALVEAVVAGEDALATAPRPEGVPDADLARMLGVLSEMNGLLARDHELDGLVRALDGRFVAPAPGGDLLRTPEVLPTGRNLHGFDPFRLPSSYAVRDGVRQAERLIARHLADGHGAPETIALVLWGTDNLKTEGAPLAQALALMGARPRFDSYGRLTGAELVPLEELGRPRIDVVMTLSGIFRDLLPLQVRLLAEAAWLAASADEPLGMNHIRRHALAHAATHGVDLETASLRVFGNAEGAYGANVNHMVDNGLWQDEGELAETYTQRKGFAYGRSGRPVRQGELLKSVLAGVDLAYQNLDSVELGVTTVDTYFDTLGGVSRAIQSARGKGADVAPVYIGDQTRGDGVVRTLTEQVALETRTRMLNPKWYESMLAHGYEGVRQIEAHVTNTMGWSATTGQVQPWVYQQLTQTFVLDEAMRDRLAELNPTASARVASRLLEASERRYWQPEPAVLEALRRAGEELEDRLEGVSPRAAA